MKPMKQCFCLLIKKVNVYVILGADYIPPEYTETYKKEIGINVVCQYNSPAFN